MTTLHARHEGQAAVIAADVAPHRGHCDYIRRACAVLLVTGQDWTAEDVRAFAKSLAHSEGHDFTPADNLLPAVIGGLAAHGRIVEVGRIASSRPERRGSKISVWRAVR